MRLLFLLCLIFSVTTIISQNTRTVSSGYWNDPAVWLNETVPSDTIRDSLLIQHVVIYENSLIFNNATVIVKNRGVLCGFDSLFFYNSHLEVLSCVRIGPSLFNNSFVYMNNSLESYYQYMSFENSASFQTGPSHQGTIVSHDTCNLEVLETLNLFELNNPEKNIDYTIYADNFQALFQMERGNVFALDGKEIYKWKSSQDNEIQINAGIYYYVAEDLGKRKSGRIIIH